MRITAAQHVSGVLTKAQSPKGRAGFQTILCTSDLLSQEDVRTIERRVQCFPAGEEKAKWQYCRLSEERPMITRIIPIPEPDEFGRRGRYLAHSLIFPLSDWSRLDDAPFDLMQPKHFFSSLEEVLAFDGFSQGKAPAVPVEAERGWQREAGDLIRNWPGEQLNGLAWLAEFTPRMIDQGHHLQLIGSESQILDALKVVFLLGPESNRQFYSFDTNASGCDWQQDAAFWGRGLPSGNKTGARFVIDAAQYRTSYPESSAGQSPYGRWIETVANAGRLTVLQENLKRARAMARFFEGTEPDRSLNQRPDDEFSRTFADANLPLIQDRIASLLPDQLSQSLRMAALEQVGRQAAIVLHYLMEGQQARLCCELFYQTILHQIGLPLTADDLEWLTGLGKRHAGLRLLLALPPGNEPRKLEILAAMKPNQYQECLETLMGRPNFQAWQIFSPSHLSAWFRLCARSAGIEEIQQGLSSIAEYGSKQDRRQVEQVVSHLKPDQQRELQQWLDASSYRLDHLKAALTEALGTREPGAPPGESGSTFQRLKGFFARKPKRV